MTKKTFLRKLGTRLDILKEEEKKDIIDEYTSHIDEKVKKGKTESEAVEDFGDIDELADEILDAYKIKSNKRDDGSKIDMFINEFIATAKEVFKNIVNNVNEDITGFIFKVIIILLAAWALRIPFYIISELGSGIFRTLTFGFLDTALVWVWRVVVEFAYVICAVLVGYAILNNDGKVKGVADKIKSDCKKGTSKKEKEPEKKTKEEKKKTEDKKQVENKANWNQPFMVLLKIVAILFLVPFISTQIGFVIALGVLVKFIFEGIIFWGPISIMLGLLGINGVIMKFIFNSVFYPKRLGAGLLVSLMISFLFIGFGVTALVFDVMNYDYINETPITEYEYVTVDKTYLLEDSIAFSYNYGKVKIIEDDTMNNSVRIEYSYIEELVDLDYSIANTDGMIITSNIDEQEMTFREFKGVYRLFIEDVKDKEIYNYMNLFRPEYNIYINPDDIDKLNIEKTSLKEIGINLEDIYVEINEDGIKIIEID